VRTITTITQRLGDTGHGQLRVGVHTGCSTELGVRPEPARARDTDSGNSIVNPEWTSHHLNEAQRLSGTGSYIANLDEDIHEWSDELYRICEIEIGTTIKTRTYSEIVFPEDLPNFTEAAMQAKAGGQAAFACRISTTSGALKHLQGSARRISGGPLFAGAITDVTERKNAEARLRLSEGFMAKAQELSLTGSFSWSSAAAGIFTWSEQMNRRSRWQPYARGIIRRTGTSSMRRWRARSSVSRLISNTVLRWPTEGSNTSTFSPRWMPRMRQPSNISAPSRT